MFIILNLFMLILIRRAIWKISLKLNMSPSVNKEFTYLLTYLLMLKMGDYWIGPLAMDNRIPMCLPAISGNNCADDTFQV
jgi:hypothetical protein